MSNFFDHISLKWCRHKLWGSVFCPITLWCSCASWLMDDPLKLLSHSCPNLLMRYVIECPHSPRSTSVCVCVCVCVCAPSCSWAQHTLETDELRHSSWLHVWNFLCCVTHVVPPTPLLSCHPTHIPVTFFFTSPITFTTPPPQSSALYPVIVPLRHPGLVWPRCLCACLSVPPPSFLQLLPSGRASACCEI